MPAIMLRSSRDGRSFHESEAVIRIRAESARHRGTGGLRCTRCNRPIQEVRWIGDNPFGTSCFPYAQQEDPWRADWREIQAVGLSEYRQRCEQREHREQRLQERQDISQPSPMVGVQENSQTAYCKLCSAAVLNTPDVLIRHMRREHKDHRFYGEIDAQFSRKPNQI